MFKGQAKGSVCHEPNGATTTGPLLTSEESPTVIAVQRGPNVTKDGVTHWVYACCELLIVGWWCDTCKHVESTREYMVQHCQKPGTHTIARWCPKHGFESPEKSQ